MHNCLHKITPCKAENTHYKAWSYKKKEKKEEKDGKQIDKLFIKNKKIKDVYCLLTLNFEPFRS